MRLIDADLFKDKFNTDTAIGKTMRLMIDEQPTAYDVDKVVEQLEVIKNSAKAKASEYDEAGRLDLMDVYDAEAMAYRNARRIVRSALND